MSGRCLTRAEAAAKAATETIFVTDASGFKYMRPDREVTAVRRAVDAINALKSQPAPAGRDSGTSGTQAANESEHSDPVPGAEG